MGMLDRTGQRPPTDPAANVLNRVTPEQGYWSQEAVRSVLDLMFTIWLAPDLGGLSESERRVVGELVAAGRIVDALYEDQLHHQARRARRDLVELDRALGSPSRTRELLTLYDAFNGPIGTTPGNELQPFLPVDGYAPGKNVYPWAIGREELDRFLQDRPEERPALLHPRSVIRRTTGAAIRRDLAVMRRYPEIEVLHPGLGRHLQRLIGLPARRRVAFYAVPYSLAWAGPIRRLCRHLLAAATAAEATSPDLAAYLRLRARDLLTDDYEAGDAAWVRGSMGRIDAVIGSHETYDDDLFGAKTFFGLSVLVRSEAHDRALRQSMEHLQEIGDQLPETRRRRVQTDIPVGIDDIVVAFGNARNVVAQILPNDATLNRKYGRKIVFRANETTHPLETRRLNDRWRAATLPDHWGDRDASGDQLATVWHELGHYLGPQVDDAGVPVLDALGADAGLIEELKAELVAQSAVRVLLDRGLVTGAEQRAALASGVSACLRPVRPLRSQAHEAGSLIEMNYFLEQGFLGIEDGRIALRYDRHAEAINGLLRQVLSIQGRGARDDADALIERYSVWDDRHEAIAKAINGATRWRFYHPHYAILGGMPEDAVT
jgi:hypothetical protein